MDLLLVVMPFGEVNQPSLGASLLCAAARARGIDSAVRYYTFALAARIGTEFYRTLSQPFGVAMMPGDWMFAEALFGESAPPAHEYLRTVLAAQRPFSDPAADLRRFGGKPNLEYLEEDVWPRFLAARQECPPVVAQAAREILAEAPRMVGFTVGGQQICAALAVARQLKQSPEAPLVILGGPVCFGEMGLQVLRSFPWVDYVCTGEGDQVFPAFLEQLLRKGDSTPLPGILAQGARELTLPPLTTRLDELPFPDFSDYFEQLGASAVYQDVAEQVVLPFETSRGCWWGEDHACGFCGSQAHVRAFRSKSPERVADEVAHLVVNHHPQSVCLVDDVLDMRYFDTLFPLLAETGPGVPFFCDSRVNVTRAQLQVLHSAGAQTVQFGIETLSNRLLRLLPKGCTAQQGIQAVRWSLELGIVPVWNFLYGIPGEQPGDYPAMAALIPLLAHLTPPSCCYQVMIMRFSRYYEDPGKVGLLRLRPGSAYPCILPLAPEEIEGLAYYFDCEYTAGDPLGYVDPVRHALVAWMAQWSGPANDRPRLDLYRVGKSAFLVTDTRPCAVQAVHRLEGLTAEVLMCCDMARSIPSLAKELAGQADERTISQTLQTLVDDRLVWQDGGRFLSLALFRNREK